MRITDISPQKKREDRFNISVDGEYAASLCAETVVLHHLRTGMEVSAEELAAAVSEDNRKYACELAIKTLSVKRRTRGEVERYIKDKELSADAVEYALEKVADYGYIDDGAYCADFVSQMAGKGKGPHYIREKLFSHFAQRAEIEEALAGYTREAQIAAARAAAAGLDREKARRKLAAAGFDYGLITEALSCDIEDFAD